VLLVDSIRAKKPEKVGFYDAGTQVVTATSVDMGNGLPSVSFTELQKLAADPKATADFYKSWTKTVLGPDGPPGMQPISAESQ